MVMTMTYQLNGILDDIVLERSRQDAKWGVQNHDLSKWLLILMEEVGELAQALLEENPHWEEEAIQVAAVIVAMIQCYRERKTRG